MDVHAPFTNKTLKRRFPPWYSKNLRIEIEANKKLYYQAKKFNNSNKLSKFKLAKTKTRNKIRKSKVEYISNKLTSQFRANRREFWSTLNQYCGTKVNLPSAKNFFTSETLVDFYAKIASTCNPVSI